MQNKRIIVIERQQYDLLMIYTNRHCFDIDIHVSQLDLEIVLSRQRKQQCRLGSASFYNWLNQIELSSIGLLSIFQVEAFYQ